MCVKFVICKIYEVGFNCREHNKKYISICCNRECEKCDLVQNTDELLEAYKIIIHFVSTNLKISKWENSHHNLNPLTIKKTSQK